MFIADSILVLKFLLLIALIIFVITFGIPVLFGAQFAVTTQYKTKKLIALLQQYSKEGRLAELGSGDGRIVIAAAQQGYLVHGYEINPFLVWWSRRKIQFAHVGEKAYIYKKNYWHIELSMYDAVIIFGVSRIMKKMEHKLEQEMKQGSLVICNYFPLPNKQPIAVVEDAYIYKF